MKTAIHPKWNHQTKVTCSCGAEFLTGSTQDNITIDICSKCHPFFTGEMRFVDIQGRVDKFLSKQQHAQNIAKGKKKSGKGDDKQTQATQVSLKQMLEEEKKRLASTEQE